LLSGSVLSGSVLPGFGLPDVVLPDPGLPDTGLPDTGLPDTGPPAPAELAEASPPVCAGESVPPGDAPAVDDEPLAGAVALLAVEVTGDVVGWGDVLALAVELPQMVPVFCLSCVLVPLVLALTLALA
jgi:hypothetical protein